MTEYWIIAIARSEEEQHIDWVMLTRPVNGQPKTAWLADRGYIADLINEKSAIFKTATRDRAANKFVTGAEVRVYSDEFLTTHKNDTECDNLASLPEFKSPEYDIDLKELFR